MKNLLLKSLILLTLFIFIDFLFLVIVGCTTCFFGFNDYFYDCIFCQITKFVATMSAVIYFTLVFFDLKFLHEKLENNSF